MCVYDCLVLSAFLAVAFAAPQYNYQINKQESLTDHSNLGNQGKKYLPPETTSGTPIVRKQFYMVSAAEDEDSKERTKHLILGRPQVNYRIVFIKAPDSSSDNIKYSAELAPQEEKTIIYVLTKKERELDVSDIATPAPTLPSKPDIFFIKYKNNEEAKQAQKEIQDEYNKLGGAQLVAEETISPITSVIGSLNDLNANGGYNYQKNTAENQILASNSAPGPQYLPPLFKQ